jgi:hypothetical protein
VLRASIAAGSRPKARPAVRPGIPYLPVNLDLRDLQDAVADLFGQDQLRIRGHADQHLVELEVAAFARLQDAAFAQRSMKFSNSARSKNSGELNP